MKAERDEWRDKAGIHQIASAAHANRAAHLSQACRDLNKGIHRLRKGRDNAIALRAEVARLEGLIVADGADCMESDPADCRTPIHAEARAIKVRQS